MDLGHNQNSPVWEGSIINTTVISKRHPTSFSRSDVVLLYVGCLLETMVAFIKYSINAK